MILDPAESFADDFLMSSLEARLWLEHNWRSLHQRLDDIAARKVTYAVPVDGYYTNMGPNEPGVYFLFDDEELVYIGKAASISHRVWTHYRSRNFYWRYLSWIECPREVNEEVEHFYIRLLRPCFNARILERHGHAMEKLVKRG